MSITFDGNFQSSRGWFVVPVGLANPTHIKFEVSTSSQLALPANQNRKFALFQNDSDVVIYLGFGTIATVNSGIRLNPGDSFKIQPWELFTGAVCAIHGGNGTKNLLVTEGI